MKKINIIINIFIAVFIGVFIGHGVLLDTGFILFGTSKLIPNYTLCNQHRGIQAS